jgi:hypothetical protein
VEEAMKQRALDELKLLQLNQPDLLVDATECAALALLVQCLLFEIMFSEPATSARPRRASPTINGATL